MKHLTSYYKTVFIHLLLTIVISSYSVVLLSQDLNKIKELNAQLKKANSDSLKVDLLVKISGEYSGSNTDSAMQVALIAKNLAEKLNNDYLLGKCFHNIGVTYYYKGDYNEALECFFKSLKINEALNNKKEIGAVSNNIGNVYWMQENYEGALEFYFRDYEISKELGDEVSVAKTLGNIGLVYDNKGESDKALEYYYKGLVISDSLNDKTAVTNANINIGVVYQDRKDHKNAIKYFLKAYEMAYTENNKDALALVYINAGSSYMALNDFAKAEDFLIKSVEICKEIGSKNYLRYSYNYLSRLFYKKGDYKSALDYYSKSVAVKDSIFNEEKSKQMAEMQTMFETEKKQKQIEIQKLKLDQKDLEINKKQFVIYGTTAGFILMVLLALIIFRSYRQKKKSNEIILMQNKSLEQANEEIKAQRDEIEAQRDSLDLQNNTLEIVNTKITDSINYAKYIQQAVLPTDSVLNKLLNDYFILFKPKDIVSGDFYWATKVNELLIVAVADCTGHGVPGAFMSMLGISFLNEIVRKKEVNQANQVLNLMRLSIIDALNQSGKNEEQKDGMDMSLIAIKSQEKSQIKKAPNPKFQNPSKENDGFLIKSEIEHQTSIDKSETSNIFEAQWAGANNPLWVVKSSKIKVPNLKTQENSSLDLELEDLFLELKGDKMPIAIFDNMHNFTNHHIQLQKGDIIYLMTDGYEDAIGGSKGKKFLSKNLKQLLINNSSSSMHDQKTILEKTINEWIGNEEQIDDITLMGIKL